MRIIIVTQPLLATNIGDKLLASSDNNDSFIELLKLSNVWLKLKAISKMLKS